MYVIFISCNVTSAYYVVSQAHIYTIIHWLRKLVIFQLWPQLHLSLLAQSSCTHASLGKMHSNLWACLLPNVFVQEKFVLYSFTCIFFLSLQRVYIKYEGSTKLTKFAHEKTQLRVLQMLNHQLITNFSHCLLKQHNDWVFKNDWCYQNLRSKVN